MLTSGAVAPVSDSRRWLVSGVAYAASFIGATIALHAFDHQPARFISWLVAVVLGSTIAALLVGRPPALLPLVLFPAYYVVVALSVSGYDESRWSYSRLEPGGFFLGCQLLVMALVIVTLHPRPM